MTGLEPAEGAWQAWYEPEFDIARFMARSPYDKMRAAFAAGFERGARVYSLFAVDLTGHEPGEAPGDGTEQPNMHEWVTATELAAVMDPQVHVMFGRLAAKPAPKAAANGAAGRLARVEVKGFRDLGIVRVTESTLAGEAMLRAESTDGAVAEFPASSLHFITWLPEGAQVPAHEEPAAIGGGGCYPDEPWNEERF